MGVHDLHATGPGCIPGWVENYASSVFGVQMAAVIGPYFVIVICAMGGAAVAILQRESSGNVRAFVYFLAMTSLSVLLTVPLTEVVVTYLTPMQEQWLFTPVAFALGYLGDKLGEVFTWCGQKINQLVDALIAARGSK